jgi:hypothetical protein
MSYVTKFCGCEFDVDEGWDYGCGGDCCGSYSYAEDVDIIKICSEHMVELNSKFGE